MYDDERGLGDQIESNFGSIADSVGNIKDNIDTIRDIGERIKGAEHSGDASSPKPDIGQSSQQTGANSASTASTGTNAGAVNKASGASTGATVGAEAGATGAGASAGASGAAAGAEAGAAATGAAEAAASSTGVGAVVAAAMIAAKKIKENEEKDFKDQSHPFLIVAIAVGAFFYIVMSTYMLKVDPGALENGSQKSFTQLSEDENFKGEEIKKFTDEDLDDYDKDAPYYEIANDYINGIGPGTGIKDAMNKAITEECHTLIKELKSRQIFKFLTRIFNGYNEQKSLENFYSKPFPYDIVTPESTIGNVIDGTYTPTYNDVNFAEVITILCQNPKYDHKNVVYEDFNDYIHSKEAQNYYYEVDLQWYVTYETDERDPNGNKYPDIDEYVGSEEDAQNAPDTLVINGHDYKFKEYFVDPIVFPFGLRELYLLAEVDADDMNSNFELHSNIEMLDRSENYARIYAREKEEILGPSFDEPRNTDSLIYSHLQSFYGEPKGRSGWYYIADPYNLSIDLANYQIPADLQTQLIEMYKNLPDGANTLTDLDEFMKNFWIYQMAITDKSGIGSLCAFSSYMMVAQFENNKKFDEKYIAQLARKYCSPGGVFGGGSADGLEFMKEFALQGFNPTSTSAGATAGATAGVGSVVADVLRKSNGNASDAIAFSLSQIASAIDNGHPAIVHVTKGTTSDNKYHDTHFMVAVGYEDGKTNGGQAGIWVADPGRSSSSGQNLRFEPLDNISTWQNATVRYYESTK